MNKPLRAVARVRPAAPPPCRRRDAHARLGGQAGSAAARGAVDLGFVLQRGRNAEPGAAGPKVDLANKVLPLGGAEACKSSEVGETEAEARPIVLHAYLVRGSEPPARLRGNLSVSAGAESGSDEDDEAPPPAPPQAAAAPPQAAAAPHAAPDGADPAIRVGTLSPFRPLSLRPLSLSPSLPFALSPFRPLSFRPLSLSPSHPLPLAAGAAGAARGLGRPDLGRGARAAGEAAGGAVMGRTDSLPHVPRWGDVAPRAEEGQAVALSAGAATPGRDDARALPVQPRGSEAARTAPALSADEAEAERAPTPDVLAEDDLFGAASAAARSLAGMFSLGGEQQPEAEKQETDDELFHVVAARSLAGMFALGGEQQQQQQQQQSEEGQWFLPTAWK